MIKKKIKKILEPFIPWIGQDKKIYKLYVIANKLSNKGYEQIANYYAYKIFKKSNCYISPKSIIGKNVSFPHPTGIVIGTGVKIGENCVIYQNVTLGRKNRDLEEYPEIGNNVILYCNSTVVGNIKIGNNAITGCNSVVLRDVKDGEVVSGIVK